MNKTIRLNGKDYTLVRAQRDGNSGVYKGNGVYLRIGEASKIKKDLQNHRKMESAHFPIPHILEEGELNGSSYFIETSLGEHPVSQLFINDIGESNVISEKHFDDFLFVTEQMGKAQLCTQRSTKDYTEFESGIHLQTLCNELPKYSEKIMYVYNNIKERISIFPFVFSHGDYNPHNIYATGTIDFEDSFYAPFGYDLVGAIEHISYTPQVEGYEYIAKYSFTEDQKSKYYASIDTLALQEKLPNLSEYKHDFEFCRAVWLLVRMDKWPKLQKYRYNLFIQKFLN